MALAQCFDASLPGDERVERRKMFGCPCAFVNGNMFAGVHEDKLIVRLPPEERERSVEEGRAQPCEIMGRVMREYVLLPDPLERKAGELRGWIERAFAYASELSPKQPKEPKKKAARKAGGKPAVTRRGR